MYRKCTKELPYKSSYSIGLLTLSIWTLLTWQYVQVLVHVALACLMGLWLFIYHCVSSALQSCILPM